MILRTHDVMGWRDFAAGDIAADDRGLLLGDGVFETFLADAAGIRHSAAHRARFHAACEALDFDPPGWADVEAEVARLGLTGRHACRLNLMRGPGPRGLAALSEARPVLWLSLAMAQSPPASLTLALSRIRRSPDSIAACHKTFGYTDNAAARREAEAAGAGMAMLLTTDGMISGADCANIFAVSGRNLLTPSRSCAIRCGVTRERVLAQADKQGLAVREDQFTPAQFERADALFVTNAVMDVVPVRRLGDVEFDITHADVTALRRAHGGLD